MICSQISMATSLTNASNRARAEFSLNNDLYFSVCYSHKAIAIVYSNNKPCYCLFSTDLNEMFQI